VLPLPAELRVDGLLGGNVLEHFRTPLNFPRPPSYCAERSPQPLTVQHFRKKGGERLFRRGSIQKKPQEMDISLRQNRAFNVNTEQCAAPHLMWRLMKALLSRPLLAAPRFPSLLYDRCTEG
jgi:hypothetical protein